MSAADAAKPPGDMGGHILVPFAYESPLSGVGKASIPNQKLWYRRTFILPSEWGERTPAPLPGREPTSEVFVNGRSIGSHRGGFDGFSFDITDALKPGENEITWFPREPAPLGRGGCPGSGQAAPSPGGHFLHGGNRYLADGLAGVGSTNHIDSASR